MRLTTTLKQPLAKTVYLGAIVSGGILVIGTSIWELAGGSVGLPWFLLVGLTVLSGAALLRLPNAPASFSVSDSFTMTAALLFGPAAGAAAVAIDTLVISLQLVRREFRLQRLLFNIASPPLAMWIAARCFFWVAATGPLVGTTTSPGRLLGPLLVFAAIYFVLNTGFIAAAIAFEQRTGPIAIWRRHFLPLWLGQFGGASVAVLLISLVQARGADPAVLVPVASVPLILYAMFKTTLGRLGDQLGHLEQVNKMHLATIETLAHAIDAKDQVTHGHIRRVQYRAMRLAAALKIDDERERQALYAASLLHDTGKLAVPEHILNKPGKLTPVEFETMKQHATIGADILSSIDFPFPVVPIVRHHHENWDGTGYPSGIKGEQIPIGARILSVVDCFDALTSDRPYRPKMSDAEALAILQERSGTMYDPSVVARFLETYAADAPNAELRPVPPALGAIVETAQSDAARRWGDNALGVDAALLNAMCDLGTGLARGRDSTAEHLYRALARLMPATSIVIYEHDAGVGQLIARHVAGRHAAALTGLSMPFGQRLTGWVAAQGSSIVNSDAALDLGSLAMVLNPRPRSCLSTALSIGDQVVGALTIYSEAPEAFTDRHLGLVQLLAPRIAAAIGATRDAAAASPWGRKAFA